MNTIIEANRTHLYEVSLLPALSILDSGWSVSVQRAPALYPDLSVLVDILAWLGVVDTGPAGGYQDVDLAEVSPSLAGGVELVAAFSDPGLDVLNDLQAICF